MRPTQRFMTAGLAVAAGEIAIGALLLPGALAGYFFACAAASALLGVVARRLLEPPPGEDEPGGGGGPPGGGDDPPPPPPPPWWPQFEAEFRRHVHEREQRLTSVGPPA